MSSEQVAAKARETLKEMKQLLEKAELAAHRAASKTAPAVGKSLDASFEAAGKGFTGAMKTIDSATGREQLELLRAYQKFLNGQADFVGAKVRALEQRSDSKKQS